jgi:nucleotide-binding universal stress UspA family protein
MSAAPVKRVVVATDFSDGAARALAVAIRLAKLLGATVDVVHVYPMAAPGVLSPIPGVVPMPPPPPHVMDEIERRLEALATQIRAAGVERLTTSLEGRAADEIAAYAIRVAADFIVMGTHGRTGIRRVPLGSVAEQVLRQTRCPLLIVPPPDDVHGGGQPRARV